MAFGIRQREDGKADFWGTDSDAVPEATGACTYSQTQGHREPSGRAQIQGRFLRGGQSLLRHSKCYLKFA